MPRQERAVRTRNALIESAAELFGRDGFELVSLAAISSRAGVSSGALHFHFPNKEALAEAVVLLAGQRLDDITARPAGRPLQALIDALHCLTRALRSDVILRAGFDLSWNPVRVRVTRDLRRTWQEWVEEVLRRAEREGSLAQGVDARDVANTVVAAAAGFETLGGRDPRWFSQATVTGFWALLLPRLVDGPALGELVASGAVEEGVRHA
ncbi:TetR/AcrR family transcriptional regulator (plasmid) [Streptomyces sp. NBC_00335]|uniref:ScbR family autoregulator-binding transcription factor n=1 Tax=unclassified Streptomyces TaxID=2593676 RepID=UPI0022590653|nr:MULTISPECIES: ScbR family autoregulator-binding transcription factor [unclassified Streptomyces]MCX5410011.1 ScbR family autoregulator-binding transcription factor [Streptomyces sp. NBC_00086]